MINYTTNTKKAFTMIELVFVIIVLGILASLAMPRLDRDMIQEAKNTILSNIRYTQHLAMIDFKHSFDNPNWQREFWRIEFESCANDTGFFFSIGSDNDDDGALAQTETATDPTNGKPLFWLNTQACDNGGDGTVSENIFLSKKFGVTGVAGAAGCEGVQYIGFDHLGRPHTGFTASNQPDYASVLHNACLFTFTMSDNSNFTIVIEPETGYAYLQDQPDS